MRIAYNNFRRRSNLTRSQVNGNVIASRIELGRIVTLLLLYYNWDGVEQCYYRNKEKATQNRTKALCQKKFNTINQMAYIIMRQNWIRLETCTLRRVVGAILIASVGPRWNIVFIAEWLYTRASIWKYCSALSFLVNYGNWMFVVTSKITWNRNELKCKHV